MGLGHFARGIRKEGRRTHIRRRVAQILGESDAVRHGLAGLQAGVHGTLFGLAVHG